MIEEEEGEKMKKLLGKKIDVLNKLIEKRVSVRFLKGCCLSSEESYRVIAAVSGVLKEVKDEIAIVVGDGYPPIRIPIEDIIEVEVPENFDEMTGKNEELDEDTIHVLKFNHKQWLKGVTEEVNDLCDGLEEVRTRDEIMVLKRNFIINLLEILPISSNLCYDCLINDYPFSVDPCMNCDYAKKHGYCTEDSSDWLEVNYKRNELISLIKKAYK